MDRQGHDRLAGGLGDRESRPGGGRETRTRAAGGAAPGSGRRSRRRAPARCSRKASRRCAGARGRGVGRAPSPARDASRASGKSGERGVVTFGDLAAPGVLPLEEGELGPEDRGLELVEPRVPALALGVVAAVPAVLAQLPEAAGDLGVVGRDRAAVAVGAEVLGGIEREGRRAAEAARRRAPRSCAPWLWAQSSTSGDSWRAASAASPSRSATPP